MNQKNIAIQIRNLSKVYKLYERNIHRLKEALRPGKQYHQPFYALRDLNLVVKKGEILGIVGKNGAGKSTLLKIISGIITPTMGSCRVRGKVSTILGVDTGFNPELTGIENILLDGTIKGFSKKEMDQRMDQIISFAEIGDFVKQPIKSYSSGMKTRLGFALAVHIDPEILILDEVLSVGDELFKRKCFAKMEELFNTGCTVLFVSHNAPSINEICTRAIFLENGERLLDGQPKLVTTFYLKYLYTKPANQKKVKEEITQLNHNEKMKKKFEVISEKNDNEYSFQESIKFNKKEKDETENKAFFLDNFKSKSAVEHKNHEVHIKNIHLRTLDGGKVNTIIMNEEYIYSFEAIFDIAVQNVIFGSRFTTVKGFFISGMNSKNFLQKTYDVRKGDRFLIEYNFTCTLLPGNYYIAINVSGDMEKKLVPLNHITDALVFKVQNIPPAKHRGIVHLDQKMNVKRVDGK